MASRTFSVPLYRFYSSYEPMPTNKNAQERYRILDRCLRDTTRRYTYDDLVAACVDKMGYSISLRTIQKDLEDMKMIYGFELEPRCGRTRYLRYAKRGFSIYQQELSDKELSQLRETLSVLSRFKGLPQFEWMEELAAGLEDKFLYHEHQAVLGFERTAVKGIEHLKPIFNAIVQKRVLHIVYRSFKKAENEEWDIHPYYIKQYNNRWFCFGLNNNEYRNITHIALDRIISLKPQTEISYIPTELDFEGAYFKDVIGVSVDRNKPVEEVLLRFHPQRFPYIETKSLHPSQRTIDKEQGIIQLNVQLNNELESLILSFGNQVEVLRPAALRVRIKEKIAEMMKFY